MRDDFTDVAERLSKRTLTVPCKGSPLLSMTIADEDCWQGYEAITALNARIGELERVLTEFAILGHGKCSIGKPLAAMARAALEEPTP